MAKSLPFPQILQAFLPAETQAKLNNVMTRHIADRNGEVVAQWLTRPASLAEITNLGIQPVLRLASEVLADERVIISAFADTANDIRSHVRKIRREQLVAWALFDQDQRESAGR